MYGDKSALDTAQPLGNFSEKEKNILYTPNTLNIFNFQDIIFYTEHF